MGFYTSVQCLGNNILYRGVIDGKRVKARINYSPSLFVPSKNVTNFTSLDGIYLDRKVFGDISEARDYIKQFKDVDNSHKIYGNNRFEYAYIADQHQGMVEWDQDKILIGVIDIEVSSENGFPNPYDANEPITAITITYLNGDTYAFGCGDYQVQNKELYVKCKDEYTLCKKFMELWKAKCPDILTGWNTKFFDVPYIINRFKKILGEDEAKKLSPWGHISERQAFVSGRQLLAYDILGVSSLDYIELYKWYAPSGKSQESYKLNSIANVELGESKLSFEEYDTLNELYRLNFQKFLEYNIKDVELIIKLEDKLKLLELAITLAYDTKSNYDDVFAQTRMWDALTYSYLLERNIIVPPKITKDKDASFEGAYVKSPQVGKHDWVASFDLDSLYPHLLMQYNVSPETLIQPENYTQEMLDILSSGISVDKMLKKEVDTSKLVNATITPNGQFFRTDHQGFLPKMMEEMYQDRKKFKNLMLQAKQDYENVLTELEKRGL